MTVTHLVMTGAHLALRVTRLAMVDPPESLRDDAQEDKDRLGALFFFSCL